MMDIAILILAAGSASRMGSIKQLLPHGNSTLLTHAIANALHSDADRVFCVIGAKADVVKDAILYAEVTTIYNPNHKESLSSSIVAEISFLGKNTIQIDALLVMLADQPFVDADYINRLIATSAHLCFYSFPVRKIRVYPTRKPQKLLRKAFFQKMNQS